MTTTPNQSSAEPEQSGSHNSIAAKKSEKAAHERVGEARCLDKSTWPEPSAKSIALTPRTKALHEWKHKTCALTFSNRRAMRAHWRRYHG